VKRSRSEQKQSSDAICLRQLPLSTADDLNDCADCIDHQLRLFLVYFMAAIRFGDAVEHWEQVSRAAGALRCLVE